MCLLARRQVILVGAVHFLGGMMMRMPLWRLPLMEPPLASTMKLTRNLTDSEEEEQVEEEERQRKIGGSEAESTKRGKYKKQWNVKEREKRDGMREQVGLTAVLMEGGEVPSHAVIFKNTHKVSERRSEER